MTRAPGALLAAVTLCAACKSDPEEPPLDCRAGAVHPDFVPVPGELRLVVETSSRTEQARLARDLERYLEAMFGVELAPAQAELGALDAPVLVASTASATWSRLGLPPPPPDGYALHGDGRRLAVLAPTPALLAQGGYALLEELGARFFHPRQELIPALGGARWPARLERVRRPWTRVRGLQLHLLHPTEYIHVFNGTSGLPAAQELIDWLVKTGQNHLQWPITRTQPFEAWAAHAREVVEYAHDRGVTVGVIPLLFGRSALQNNFVLVSDPARWEADLAGSMERLLSVPFDDVEIGLGEFLRDDPENLIRWLDAAVAHAARLRPRTRVAVVNHVGDFPDLYVDFRGQRTFFYFVPQYADPALIQTVHTVSFFDLYRPWGAYGHADFSGHRSYLFSQLPRRTVRYLPESAYWVSADVDVPIFLPEFIYSRWLDIHRLAGDITAAGLPPLEGHVLFSSGHEWGYWLTDYLTARMLWTPEATFSELLAHHGQAFGACAGEITASLERTIALESDYLFDRRLVAYLMGEDLHDDLGAVAGFVTMPARLPFEQVVELRGEERSRFIGEVVEPLEAFAGGLAAEEAALGRVCAGSDAALQPWCAELLDGVAVTRLRATHSAALQRAVLADSTEQGQGSLGQAEALAAEAAQVIARREQAYRYPGLTEKDENPTIYKFGYLHQAHTQCFWVRQRLQARHVVERRRPIAITELPSCVE